MATASITSNFLQALDIHFDLVAKVSFYSVSLFNRFTQAVAIFFGKVFGTSIGVDIERGKDLVARWATNTINIRQRNFDALVIWEVDTGNTEHSGLALSLLMFRILTDDENNSLSLHDLAMGTDFFY